MGLGDWLTKEEVREIIDDKLNNQDGVWKNIGNLWDKLNNEEDGVWKNIGNLWDNIGNLWELHRNPEWGIWRRIQALEAENAALKQRVDQLEHDLPARLEQILINEVNKQFKNK